MALFPPLLRDLPQFRRPLHAQAGGEIARLFASYPAGTTTRIITIPKRRRPHRASHPDAGKGTPLPPRRLVPRAGACGARGRFEKDTPAIESVQAGAAGSVNHRRQYDGIGLTSACAPLPAT